MLDGVYEVITKCRKTNVLVITSTRMWLGGGIRLVTLEQEITRTKGAGIGISRKALSYPYANEAMTFQAGENFRGFVECGYKVVFFCDKNLLPLCPLE